MHKGVESVIDSISHVRKTVREHNAQREEIDSKIIEVDKLETVTQSFDSENPHGAEHERLREIRDRLAAQSQLIMRLGHMLLESGASSYRVKISMARLAKAVGVDEHQAQVTFGEISSTVYAHGTFRTEVSEQRTFGTNAVKLDRLRHFVQHLKSHISVEDANAVLDRIASFKPEYGTVANMLAAGVACACFCFLNRGGFMECLIAGIAATVGQAVRRQMMTRHMNHFGVWMNSGLVAAVIYILLATLTNYIFSITGVDPSTLPTWFTGTTPGFHAGIISAVLFLVPGFPLITGILDLVRTDISAGLSRLTYVLMLVISAAVSVWLTALVFQWTVDPPKEAPVGGPALYLVRMVCSFVAAYGFAMLFNSDVKLAAWAAAICALVNPLRFWAVDNGLLYWQLAVGIESVLIGLAAHVISQLSSYRYSRVSLTVPAAVIMIPGVPLYAALTRMNEGDYLSAMSSLIEVMLVITAIGVGLSIARMLTDPGWRSEHDLSRILEAENSFHMR